MVDHNSDSTPAAEEPGSAEPPALAGVEEQLARQRQVVATLEREQKQLRQLILQKVTDHERERYRLSRSLHDEAGQILTALKLSLEMALEDLALLAKQLPEQEERIELIQTQLQQAKGFGEETAVHIQGLMQQLYPSALHDLGLNAALEGLCQDFAKSSGLAVAYEYGGPPRPALSAEDDVKITLYRCLDEALANVAQHADADSVNVILRADDDAVFLSVRDDGRGFVPAQEKDWKGLLELRERVWGCGGYLDLESAPSEGTHLVVHIPW